MLPYMIILFIVVTIYENLENFDFIHLLVDFLIFRNGYSKSL
jgi:hypothetical protein